MNASCLPSVCLYFYPFCTCPVCLCLYMCVCVHVFCVCVCVCVCSNCSDLWGLGSGHTIEQWDSTGMYGYPDHSRWIYSRTHTMSLYTSFHSCKRYAVNIVMPICCFKFHPSFCNLWYHYTLTCVAISVLLGSSKDFETVWNVIASHNTTLSLPLVS